MSAEFFFSCLQYITAHREKLWRPPSQYRAKKLCQNTLSQLLAKVVLGVSWKAVQRFYADQTYLDKIISFEAFWNPFGGGIRSW